MKSTKIIYLIVFANLLSVFILIKIASFDKMINYSDKGELSITPFQFVIFPIIAILISSFFLFRNRNK